jgi:tetratricopeptide (TPR) repeat protein
MKSDRNFDVLLAEANTLIDSQKYQEALKILEHLASAAEDAADVSYLKVAIREQAFIHADKLKYDEKAAYLFEQLTVLSQNTNDKTNLLTAFYGHALSCAGMGNQYGIALDKFEKAEALAKEMGHEKVLFSSLERMIDIYNKQAKNYEKALDKLDTYISLCREVGNMVKLDIALKIKGLCFESLERFDKALDVNDERKKLAEALGRKETVAFCLNNAGFIHSRQTKNYEVAYLNYVEAEPICREINDLDNLKASLQSQAFLLRYRLNLYEDALAKYRDFEKFSRENGNDTDLLDIFDNEVWLLIEVSGDYDEAMKVSLEMEELANKVGSKEKYISAMEHQVLIHKQWGEKDLASKKKERIKKLK